MNMWILKFSIVYVRACMCLCVFFVIFPVKIALTLISMLMYSCLHLTLEYVTANYHYTGWKIRALSEVLGFRNKERPIRHLGSRPNNCNRTSWIWWGLCLYFFYFFSLNFWRGLGGKVKGLKGLKFPLEHDVNMLACLLLLRCHPTDNKSCCVLPT